MKDASRTVPVYTILLIVCTVVSIFLHFSQTDALCLNEDEAAQGYNTYSVLKTGLDEYGRIPVRYLSFGENKFPLSGMLGLPFIAAFGLNALSVRLPALIAGIALPLAFYCAVYAVSGSRKAGVIAAVLSSMNPWIITMTRHLHEAVFLTLNALVIITLHASLTREDHAAGQSTTSRRRVVLLIVWGVCIFLALSTYQSAKIIVPYLVALTIATLWRRRSVLLRRAIVVCVAVFVLFAITDIISPTDRVSRLSYFTSPAFIHEIEQGRRLGGSSLYYNKVVYGTHRFVSRLASYFAPSFYFGAQDLNSRFRIPHVFLLSRVEYVLALLGLLYLLLTRHPTRWMLTAFLVISALPAVLAFPEESVTRSFTMIVPLIMVVSIMKGSLVDKLKLRELALAVSRWTAERHPPQQDHVHSSSTLRSGYPAVWWMHFTRLGSGVLVGIAVIVVCVAHVTDVKDSLYSYFVRYLDNPRDLVVGQWQCGAKEMAGYVWQNYNRYSKIVVSRAYGQPYIYLLFYGGPYPPRGYQRIARTMPLNEYGFWEQDGFDKFVFQDPVRYTADPDTLYIMTPQEADDQHIPSSLRTAIKHRGQTRYFAVRSRVD